VQAAEQLFERMRHAPPLTEGDVTILWDGTRVDSREKVLAWLAELELARAVATRLVDVDWSLRMGPDGSPRKAKRVGGPVR
jgi:hypothetical protein